MDRSAASRTQQKAQAQAQVLPVLAKGPAPVQAGNLAVVVGAGASGLAAAKLLAALGARVRLVDNDPAHITPAVTAMAQSLGLECLAGPHEAAQFAGAHIVVSSPGVPLAKLAPFLASAGSPPLMAEMDLALHYVREPIIAVTGTSGKTTTVSLTAAMLEAGGKKVFLGGNIGTPLSEYVLQTQKADVLVLEMSSFQLQGTRHLTAHVAALLNLTANHLDHHKDMAEYADAKFGIFAGQGPDDVALLPQELADEYARRGGAARFEAIGPATQFSATQFPATRLLGRHNLHNIQAAWLAAREFGVSHAQAAQAVAAFAPLEHRLEKVGEAQGVVYVNDSKSTTVDSLQAALNSFDNRVLLLAGGKFKGGDLLSLRPLLERKVGAVALFGASREIFEKAWEGCVPLSWDAALPEALARLQLIARPGDAVLLSPATASYDLYRNYMERGDHFRHLVAQFAKKSEQGL